MALVAAVTRTSVTDDGLESIFSDGTEYGAPEADRNQVAVWFTAFKMDVNQVATALAVDTFDPEAATSFTAANGVDGWHRYMFIIAPRWDVAVEYNQYDIVWDEAEAAFYEYTYATATTGNLVTDTFYWTLIADPTTKIADVGTAEESGNLVYQVIDKVVSFQTSICNLKAASKHAKEVCNTGACDCDTTLGKYYMKIRNLFAIMAINETTGQYIEGEKNARLAEKYCDDCGCLTR